MSERNVARELGISASMAHRLRSKAIEQGLFHG
jgi:hypothetical protein